MTTISSSTLFSSSSAPLEWSAADPNTTINGDIPKNAVLHGTPAQHLKINGDLGDHVQIKGFDSVTFNHAGSHVEVHAGEHIHFESVGVNSRLIAPKITYPDMDLPPHEQLVYPPEGTDTNPEPFRRIGVGSIIAQQYLIPDGADREILGDTAPIERVACGKKTHYLVSEDVQRQHSPTFNSLVSQLPIHLDVVFFADKPDNLFFRLTPDVTHLPAEKQPLVLKKIEESLQSFARDPKQEFRAHLPSIDIEGPSDYKGKPVQGLNHSSGLLKK